MSKTLDRTILERAIKLVEAGWTQYAYARDANGKAVDWRSGAATSFCAVGAILRAMHDLVGGRKTTNWPFEALQLPRSIACVNHHNLVTEIADTRRSGTRGQPLLFSISDWMARVDVEHIWDSNFCEATGGP